MSLQFVSSEAGAVGRGGGGRGGGLGLFLSGRRSSGGAGVGAWLPGQISGVLPQPPPLAEEAAVGPSVEGTRGPLWRPSPPVVCVGGGGGGASPSSVGPLCESPSPPQGMHWKGGRYRPPPPPSKAPSLCPATVCLTAGASFNGI